MELSSTLLGALTCETSVLATPVRGIPDIIIGGKTGFIMENHSLDLERITEYNRRFRGECYV